MQQTFSLHKINDGNSFGFSAVEYSGFKFGDDMIAEKFGVALAEQFIRQYLRHHPISAQIVVISSPYSFLPTATFAMKNYFVFTLNRWLAENNFSVVQETKVHRTITYKEDYGELDAEQRMNLIGNDSFHIDKDFLVGKTLLFLDDIKITGSHERMINKMLTAYNLHNDTHLLYFAELENKNIHPNIENQLNYSLVKSIFDINPIIKNERFSINTRLVKYLLNAEPVSFKIFIQSHSADFINLLYDSALGNGYHLIEAYQQNLAVLKAQIHLINQTSLTNIS
ncbi:MAG: phosphoribosyltransferase family protein [Ferruginibacter sp.]